MHVFNWWDAKSGMENINLENYSFGNYVVTLLDSE